MKRSLTYLGYVSLIVFTILAWHTVRLTYTEMASYDEIAEKRYEWAKAANPIKIAIVCAKEGGSEGDSLWNGACQAQDEINNRKYPLEDETGNPLKDHGKKPYYHKYPVKDYDLEEGGPVCKGIPVKVQTGVRDGNPVWEIQCTKIELQKISSQGGRGELDAARQIARDPRFVAVIGHDSNDIAKFAAVSYQQMGLLFLSVNVTDPSLTNHDFSYVFRTIPNDYVIAKATARMFSEFRSRNGMNEKSGSKMGIFYARSAYAMTAVDTISASLEEVNPEIQYVFEKSYDMTISPPRDIGNEGLFYHLVGLFSNTTHRDSPETRRKKLGDMIDEVRNKYSNRKNELQFDAVLLIDDQAERAGEVLRWVRRRSIDKPVIGGVGLDAKNIFKDSVVDRIYDTLSDSCQEEPHDHQLASSAGSPSDSSLVTRSESLASGKETKIASNNLKNVTLIASIFDPASPLDSVKRFVDKFRKYNRQDPDPIAAQGYEAIRILAEAFERSESIAPIDVADALRSRGPFDGLTGKVCFTREGNVRGKRIYLKVLKNKESNSSQDAKSGG